MKAYSRADRIAEEIRKTVGGHWDAEMAEHSPGMVTFTYVRLSKDLRHATIYYSFLSKEENNEAVADYIQAKSKQLRQVVGSQLRVRHVPELTFKYDPSIQEGVRIEQLLNEIKSDKRE
ncbi:MAG: 30S ribosome-binding factor RbfA [bacterium]